MRREFVYSRDGKTIHPEREYQEFVDLLWETCPKFSEAYDNLLRLTNSRSYKEIDNLYVYLRLTEEMHESDITTDYEKISNYYALVLPYRGEESLVLQKIIPTT
ncbi:hypothetical protein [Anaerovibrio sp.]|uniref:hypothetical protein n=1 Tax=Anaerovibrio sp. TaxID=1872532 RepID=UPI0038900EC0